MCPGLLLVFIYPFVMVMSYATFLLLGSCFRKNTAYLCIISVLTLFQFFSFFSDVKSNILITGNLKNTKDEKEESEAINNLVI